jgi:surfeit locus 1 family protein
MSQTSAETAEAIVAPAAVIPPRAKSRLDKFREKHGNIGQEITDWFNARQPRPVSTVIALTCVFILLGLGTWQLQRLHWKNGLLQQAMEDFKLPPADLRKHPPVNDADWSALHYKSVVLQGKWLTPFHAIKMGPRTYNEDAGYQLVVPLLLADNQVVLINRGFATDKVALLPPETQAAVIHGVVYQPETTKPYFMPENIPSRNEWVWPDVVAMGHEFGRDHVAPVMVFENRISDHEGFPIGGQLPLPNTNSHWHYAATWYALALALLGVWLMASNPTPAKPESTLGKDAEGKQKDLNDPVAKRGMYPEATD